MADRENQAWWKDEQVLEDYKTRAYVETARLRPLTIRRKWHERIIETVRFKIRDCLEWMLERV